MCRSCGPLGRRGDPPARGDEANNTVFGVAIKRLVRKSRLEDGRDYSRTSQWTLGIREQTRLNISPPRRSVLSALALSTRISFPPSRLGHRFLGSMQGTTQQSGLQETRAGQMSACFAPPCPVSTCCDPQCPVSACCEPTCPVSTCCEPPCPVSACCEPPCPVSACCEPPCPVSACCEPSSPVSVFGRNLHRHSTTNYHRKDLS